MTNRTQRLDVQNLTKPRNLTGTFSGGTVQLTWTAASDNNALGGYEIDRDGALLDDNVAADATSDTDFGPPAGGTHLYQVRAVDEDANVGPPAGVSMAT